jgi:hypothetical protein
MQAGGAYEISSKKVKHRAERRARYETFAPVPSFLQGHTSIERVSQGIPGHEYSGLISVVVKL